MTEILQRTLPEDMHAARALPGVQPERGMWLRVDEAYAAQMALREDLIRRRPEDVLYLQDSARAAAEEVLDEVLGTLPVLGFDVGSGQVRCPDGRRVEIVRSAPLETLGRLCQSDFVLMEKVDDVHVLTGAVLCFPASWRLREKAGKPLVDIHVPVADYTEDVARRVQRLFDGLQVGRPLWRFNQLWYQEPDLFQPRSQFEPRRVGAGTQDGSYYRTERQTLVRLPHSRAVVFAIHTYVLARADVPSLT